MRKTLHPHGLKNPGRRWYFSTEACAYCLHRNQCISGKRPYRTVTRGEYSKIYEDTEKRTQENMAICKRRQQIVEHPFGTVKFTMHGNHFQLRTLRKVRAEIALLFFGYNMKRVREVLGFEGLMKR
jgi:hypothetical protein